MASCVRCALEIPTSMAAIPAPLGGRYPAQVRRTRLLAAQGHQMENQELNGRKTPARPWGQAAAEVQLAREMGRLIVMLGTS